jgi:hypothetical protein
MILLCLFEEFVELCNGGGKSGGNGGAVNVENFFDFNKSFS